VNLSLRRSIKFERFTNAAPPPVRSADGAMMAND
jgi:hypothetical protein